jgi:hypothetical protein
MDPVGVAEEYYETCNVNDLASQGILMRYPVQRHIEASALPLMPVQQLSFKMGGRR